MIPAIAVGSIQNKLYEVLQILKQIRDRWLTSATLEDLGKRDRA